MSRHRYFRTWMTLGGNHAIEVREEWEGRGGLCSVKVGRWYYKTEMQAYRKMHRLFDQNICQRIGFFDEPIPSKGE